MKQWLKKIFSKRFQKPRGIALYESVQNVIQAHKMLEAAGFQVRLVAPPPAFRVGCDLAIEFDLLEQEAVCAALSGSGKDPLKIVSTKEMLPDILRRASFVEFDDCIMCKAGNMKITIEKKSKRIVNISGGGCPDIPYVAHKLYGVAIDRAQDPIALGNSLCSYMLQISFDALKKAVR